MGNIDSLSEQELVQAHKLALTNLRKAERLAFLLPLILLLAVVAYLGWRVVNFIQHGLPQATTLVMKRAPEVIGPVLSDASVALGHLAPVYSQAIAAVYQRDLPIYQRLVASQSEALTEYAAVMHDDIQKRFMTLQAKLLQNVEGHLAPDLVGEERDLFEQTVARSLYNRLDMEVQAGWKSQIEAVDALTKDIFDIAAKIPSSEKDRKPQYMMGVALELAGLKMQEASK